MITVKEATRIANKLRRHSIMCEVAGAHRRGLPSEHDVDVVVVPKDLDRFKAALAKISDCEVSGGNARMACVIDGIPVDITITTEKSFGAAMAFFTGSRMFNIHMRAVAKRRGLTLNEKGVFKGATMIAGADEKKVFEACGVSWREPEQRSRG